MKHLNKFIIFSIILIFFGYQSTAQDVLNVTKLKKDVDPTAWHFFNQQDDIKIYYQYVDCGPIESINFKFQNTSDQKVDVSWSFVLYLNGEALFTNPDDAVKHLLLEPLGNASASCNSIENAALSIFIKEQGNVFRATLIELSNFTLTTK